MMAYQIDSKTPVHCNKPYFLDRRDNSLLLLWAELGQWMVVDDEFLLLLNYFDGERTIEDAIGMMSVHTGKQRQLVRAETLPVTRELLSRGIITYSPGSMAFNPIRSGLENVTLNLTNRCNLECPFCYNSGRNTVEMDIEKLMDRLEEDKTLYSSRASFIILGGEPFYSPRRLLKAIDRANVIFTATPPMVSTNGTLLDKTIVNELAERRVEVQVSLDSHKPSIHDKFRGKGVFELVRCGIELLVDAGVYVILSMVMTKDNIRDLEGYLETALSLGVNEARFIPLRLIGGGKRHIDRSVDLRDALNDLLRLMIKRPEFRPLLRRDYFTIQMTTAAFSVSQTACGVGDKVIFVDADGKVYPCPNHITSEHVCGSLTESGLADIFNKSPILENIRKRYHVRNYQGCAACPFRCWCAGDCRGEVFSLTGNPYGESCHCTEIRENYVKMLWFLAENNIQRQKSAGGHFCF